MKNSALRPSIRMHDDASAYPEPIIKCLHGLPSRVNNAAAVPATAPTVSRISSRSSGTFLDIAVTEVADDQRTVAQIRSASIVLRVYSMLPNERPVTVTDVPPLIAAL